MAEQPKLKLHGNENATGTGPVFEFGPGWGARLNKWFKKNWNKKLLPLLAILVLAAGLILNFSNRNTGKKTADKEQAAMISQIVLPGDSKTHLARRAITNYLKNSDDLTLTPGQRIYAETKLVKLIDDNKFKVGQIIEFDPEQIHILGHEAESLSPAALQKWEEYAKGVKF